MAGTSQHWPTKIACQMLLTSFLSVVGCGLPVALRVVSAMQDLRGGECSGNGGPPTRRGN